MTLAAFLTAWAIHLLAAASPGPSILMAARTGVTQGFRTGTWLCVGLGLGAVIWAMAALFGLALLFTVMPTLLWGLKILGGLFLIWIGLGMWRHADRPLAMPGGQDTGPGALATPTAGAALRLGLVTQLANPKPAVFFGAVFVTTVPPGAAPVWIALLLVVIFVNEFLCTLGVARAFSAQAVRRFYARAKGRVDRVFGGALALLGLRVAAG